MKPYLLLWVLCLIGACAILPYVHYLGILPPSFSLLHLFLVGIIQAAVLYGFVCFLSYKLVGKTDLKPFDTKKTPYPAITAGVMVGLVIYFFNTTLFSDSQLVTDTVSIPLWARVLSAVYGGVNEEVLLRLFLFTLIYYMATKAFKAAKRNRSYVLWGSNILVALIFGLGHLPAAFKVIEPSLFEVFRILLLNAIAGLVFGYLYWSRNLWSAMLAHFVTDVMIHALLP